MRLDYFFQWDPVVSLQQFLNNFIFTFFKRIHKYTGRDEVKVLGNVRQYDLLLK